MLADILPKLEFTFYAFRKSSQIKNKNKAMEDCLEDNILPCDVVVLWVAEAPPTGLVVVVVVGLVVVVVVVTVVVAGAGVVTTRLMGAEVTV